MPELRAEFPLVQDFQSPEVRPEDGTSPEVSLDPDDWRGTRELGHRMLDDMFSFLEGIREEPAWVPVPDAVKERLREPLPREGIGVEAVYGLFRELVFPYRVGNVHPRFWARVVGTGSVSGMLAEMLAAGINNNTATIASSALHVEEQVLEWFRSMLGLPAGSSGLLVSGGSVANLIGIAVARTAKAGVDTKRMGVRALPQNLVLYCSEETHNSVDKAASLLGLGTDWVRKVPTDDDFRIRVEALEEAIRRDLEEGHRPFCIVGNAGTVGTGATDDLSRLADVAERFGLWLHVDGAIGAVLALSPALCPRVRGIERADSVAFDLHKWMYMPYAVGGVLVRDREAHHRTFASSASYLGQTERGPEADAHRFHEFGLELSRSFGALKVWMLVKEHGVDRYTRLIEQNVGQAAYLAGLVEEHPELELLAPAPLNIVCFRYRGAGIPEERLDAANREILTRLQERGIAVPSGTRVRGRFAIRTAITNHRSRRSDFDLLAESVVAIGREVAAEVSGDI